MTAAVAEAQRRAADLLQAEMRKVPTLPVRRRLTVSAIEELITELARLPGIGRKTAQRLTFHLLQHSPEQAGRLAAALVAVSERVRPCEECGNLTEEQPCAICRDPRRDAGGALRGRGGVHRGGGRPLDRFPRAATTCWADGSPRSTGSVRRRSGWTIWWPACGTAPVREVILATNPSMEGEVTATYIQQLLAGHRVPVTRLARGLPMGGELEYVDGVTLAHALVARQDVP